MFVAIVLCVSQFCCVCKTTEKQHKNLNLGKDSLGDTSDLKATNKKSRRNQWCMNWSFWKFLFIEKNLLI